MCNTNTDQHEWLINLMSEPDDHIAHAAVAVVRALTPENRVHILSQIIQHMVFDGQAAPSTCVYEAARAHAPGHDAVVAAAVAMCAHAVQNLGYGPLSVDEFDTLVLAEHAAAGAHNKMEIDIY